MGQPILSFRTLDSAANPMVARLAKEFEDRYGSRLAVDEGGDMLARLLGLAAETEQKLIEAKQRIADLERIAETDELTGLLNHQGLRRQLSRTLAHASRYGEFGTILFIDIDDMTQINDRHGHAIGDAVIEHVGKTLLAQTRAGDLVARYGGDEFALALERCGQGDAYVRAQTMRGVLERQPLQLGDLSIDLSISFGLAPYGPHGTTDQILGFAKPETAAH